MPEIYVLRLGHRSERDKRISTHVALTARAFGAKGIYFDTYDRKVFESVRDVVRRWGGEFFVEECNWKKLLKEFDGLKVHLTMYGVPLPEKIDDIKKVEKVLAIVGAEKVPPEVYELADMNVSIGTQPHSEVAALAVFLRDVLDGKVFSLQFPDAKIRVIPSERGKQVEER
ncbi:tRNA (cytidine(56)-2'-O)-methyltransferase [Archaeoglobus veneficus]|uniref:tRNA (cytidine(56)-2'-O)-methyltransferase n=1 Tax=Archaeoglobus veneficus (strain DSM 11195 / SNP6) TaxID=693661 RepID=F2KPQ6_ARCVS|nr:tRNA (cytidine(56)-2'-O)-methyltransferase [Archaeoglobus veneficus]AEA47584.1 tRNA ribose 2'-O-methyltransferase aTrm56 [Archaeoglobus veneficus SNP6]